MSKISRFALGISNMYIIQDRKTIIVDTGFEKTRESYINVFEEAGVDPEDIALIVVTHGHSDHFSFAGELKRMTGAPVLCHKLAVTALKTGKNPKFVPRKDRKDFLNHIRGVDLRPYGTVFPDLIFDSEFDLTTCGVSGKVIHTPGHSDCSSCVVLDSGEAFVGDMLIDSPVSGEMMLPFLASDEAGLFASYRKLLRKATMFYGGHGIPLSKEEMVALIRKDDSDGARAMFEDN